MLAMSDEKSGVLERTARKTRRLVRRMLRRIGLRPPLNRPQRDMLVEQSTRFLQTLEQLEQERDKALAESENRADYLATMSHEIRTPMNGVLGMLHLLTDTALDEEQEKYVGLAKESADALLVILNDILEVSSLEAGKVRIEPVATNFETLLESTLNLFAESAHSKDLALRFHNAPLMPTVMVDAGRVRQILTNLIGNAVKFTDKGSITVSTSYHPLNNRDLMLECTVSDTGPGILPDRQADLFTRYAQVKTNAREGQDGTGLGLFICRQLCTLMGGDISVQSNPGEGSRFTFWIKCARANNTTPLEDKESDARTDQGPVMPCYVLVAEDSKSNREIIRTILNRSGHIVDVVEDGNEALQAVSRNDYDVILMDIQMPVMDGLTAATAIRAMPGRQNKVPIIALTANVRLEDKSKCISAGMDCFLTKPVVPKDLLQAIDRLTLNRRGGTAKATSVAPQSQVAQ